MERNREALERHLRARGLRVTQPRLAVLAYLSTSDAHPTADEVEAGVNTARQLLSRASVYNVLRSLREVGLVRELVAGEAATRFDANLAPHHHLVCRRCGRVEDVPWEVFAVTQREGLSGGRPVEDVSLTVRGLCRSCGSAEPRASRAPESPRQPRVSKPPRESGATGSPKVRKADARAALAAGPAPPGPTAE